MDREDRERKRAWKARERAAAKQAFPLSDEELSAFFVHVAASVHRDGCDKTLRATEAWIVQWAVDRERFVAWLHDQSGFCDCEVVANAGDHWRQNR